MFEHRDAFMETLRVGQEMRKRIFDTLEERYGQDFGSGRVGRQGDIDLNGARLPTA
jgi:hypothetical protein